MQTVILLLEVIPGKDLSSPGLGEASLQSLWEAGTEQVRRKGISCLLGTTVFLLPSQLPAWEGVSAATPPRLPGGGLQAENSSLLFPPSWQERG